MGRKPNLPRNSKKAPHRRRAVITGQLRINVLKDYHTSKMTITDICERHSICYETCRKILDTTDYKPEDLKEFNPNDVFERRNMDPITRLQLLSTDATQVIEMTLAVMKYKLQQEMTQTAGNENKSLSIPIKELTLFFAEAAPYVLTKLDKKKPSANEGLNSKRRVFDMFKRESVEMDNKTMVRRQY